VTTAAAHGSQHNILLVDDHRVFAEALALRLRAQPEIAAVEATYGLGEARAMINRFRPDLVLLDFALEEDSGLDLLPDLDRLPVRPAVLMVSGFDDPGRITQALSAGVRGWVTKDEEYETLMAAVHEVLSGHVYLPPTTLTTVIEHLLAAVAEEEHVPSFLDDLSDREVEVLRCLVSGMTRAEVADRLYISVNTVRTHVQNLLRHAGEHSTLSLVAVAKGLGVTGIDAPPPVALADRRRTYE
jgi:DNA-binding NarL/FixJ family response regulator